MSTTRHEWRASWRWWLSMVVTLTVLWAATTGLRMASGDELTEALMPTGASAVVVIAIAATHPRRLVLDDEGIHVFLNVGSRCTDSPGTESLGTSTCCSAGLATNKRQS